MQGETYKTVISRRRILQGVVDEFTAEGYKPRLTLEVCFMGERGQDLGGLRKEFLRLALQAIQGHLMVEKDATLVFNEDADMVQQQAYFAAGIVIGKFKCIRLHVSLWGFKIIVVKDYRNTTNTGSPFCVLTFTTYASDLRNIGYDVSCIYSSTSFWLASNSFHSHW